MRLRSLVVAIAVVMAIPLPGVLADDEPDGPSLSKVELLADFAVGDEADEATLDAAVVEATDIRTAGVGWGALLQIYKLAAAMGVPASDLFAEISADGEFSFGELKNSLTDEQRQLYDAMPKNLGTLIAAEKKAEAAEKKAERQAIRDERKAARDARKAEKSASDDDDSSDDG